MDEDELWLSEEDNEFAASSSDPAFFSLALTSYGQSGDFHTRNQPNQRQRPTVTSFHGGSKRKPAFTVSCNAKAMIHGEMGAPSNKRATLLVYEFKFNSYRGARIKEADVTFEFRSNKGLAGGPSVAQVRPYGTYKMEETSQTESSKRGLEFNLGTTVPAVNLGLKLAVDQSVEKITKHHTVITGDNPQSDDWGNQYQARFFLSENESQKDGIPRQLTVCILLERDGDDDFECLPYVTARPNFTTAVSSLFAGRAPDESILFSVEEAPFDKLDSKSNIDPNNLGSANLDELWGCTVYNSYGEAIKLSLPRKGAT